MQQQSTLSTSIQTYPSLKQLHKNSQLHARHLPKLLPGDFPGFTISMHPALANFQGVLEPTHLALPWANPHLPLLGTSIAGAFAAPLRVEVAHSKRVPSDSLRSISCKIDLSRICHGQIVPTSVTWWQSRATDCALLSSSYIMDNDGSSKAGPPRAA